VLACGGARESRGAAPGEGEWREFSGTRNAPGDRRTLHSGPEYRALRYTNP